MLIVMHPAGRGGAVRSTSILIGALRRRGLDVELAVVDGRAMARLRDHLPAGLVVHDLGWRSRLHLPWATWRLARLLRRGRPDLAIAVNTYSAIVLLLAARLARPIPRLIVRELMDPRQLAVSPTSRLKAALARRLYRRADAVVTSSDGVSGAVRRLFRLSARSVRRIYNGYDPALDEQSAPVAAEDRVRAAAGDRAPHAWLGTDVPVLLYVGRLVPIKGIDVLVDAVARLRAGGRPVRLMVVGEGPLRPELEALVERSGLADAVVFSGYVDRPYRHMALADMVIVPSRSEAFGNVIVEAMRVGALVVASDCDYGPREIVTPDSGVLVPADDPAALAATIERLLAEPDLARRLRAGALRRAADFSPGRMADQWLALVDELVPPTSLEE